MRVLLNKPMRRQYRSDSDWEIFDPASRYPEIDTSRQGEFIDNRFAFTRVDITEEGLPDAIHLYVGTEGDTLLVGDVGIKYDFNTHQDVAQALANISKYQDFYSILQEQGLFPTNAIVLEAVRQAQAMVDAALAE